MIDLNDEWPWYIAEGATDARLEVLFEQLFNDWCIGLAGHFEADDVYDVRDHREAFLRFCADEFDRQCRRPCGPVTDIP